MQGLLDLTSQLKRGLHSKSSLVRTEGVVEVGEGRRYDAFHVEVPG
jgi:hypothetical protein